MWSSAGLNVAWSFYQHYGDERILALTYPSSRRWLEFLHSNSTDGLLQRYDMHPGRFLGDWAAPGPRNERGDSPAGAVLQQLRLCDEPRELRRDRPHPR